MSTFSQKIALLQNWVNARTTLERVYVLLGCCFVIYIIWYVMLVRPVNAERAKLQLKIDGLTEQLQTFQTKTKAILQDIASKAYKKMPTSRKSVASVGMKPTPTIVTGTGKDDLFIRAILSANQKVKFTSLKNTAGEKQTAGTKNSIEINFHSNYFDTIAYLRYLEELPWCVSWDKLTYKVLTYPEADISMIFHIVDASVKND